MQIDVIYGFLGSGKTTFIKRVLSRWGRQERIVVLVNEFGEVGIDGTVLSQYSNRVVEMPSGCICCSLQSDFQTQLLNIFRNLKPDRVLIEPTGVASVTQIKRILNLELLEHIIDKTHYILIADAVDFMNSYKANAGFVQKQVNQADLVLLNKCDLVRERQIDIIRSAISAIKPDIYVITTIHGEVDWKEYSILLKVSDTVVYNKQVSGIGVEPLETLDSHGHHHHHEEEIGLGYESYGKVFEEQLFDIECLNKLFERMTNPSSDVGRIVRAKGIFMTSSGWFLIEVAPGLVSSQRVKECKTSKVSVIGNGLKKQLLERLVMNCIVGSN